MPFRQAAKRIKLFVPQDSLQHYYTNITKEIDSLGFEDVAVVQRHGLHPDGAAHFEVLPQSSESGVSDDTVITAYQEYRIATVVQDLSYQASLKARRMGRRAPKLKMKVTAAELPKKVESAWSTTTVSDAGYVEETAKGPAAEEEYGIAL